MNPNFLNLSNRKKRDVLFELLTGQPSDGLISKKEISSLHKLISNTSQLNSTHNKQQEKTKKSPVRKKKNETKKKSTHHLSEEVFENLESVYKEIRSIVPGNLRSGLSESQIVNHGLSLILKELKANGGNSSLVRNIIQKN